MSTIVENRKASASPVPAVVTSGHEAPLLQVDGLVRHYAMPRESLFKAAPVVRALNGVDLNVAAGQSMGIVGESGSGKSTLARAVMALETPTAGSVRLLGRDLNALPVEELRRARRDFQMVFQDPYGSLDPRQTVARIVAEPLSAAGNSSAAERRERAGEVLDQVGLRNALDKYPHEFSGGQRQRVAIARALITRPKLIVADEPVSALDVSVQAQVLNLLQDLQQQFGVTYLLISHDLAVVNHVCSHVAVIYLGRIVERGRPAQLFGAAAHPYTRALLEAVPQAMPGRRRLRKPAVKAVVSHSATAQGCSFADRCPHAQPRCVAESPALRPVATDSGHEHFAACHYAEQVMAMPSPFL
ncbi:MAG: Peptide transporter ATP-binding protein [Rhizobacter sp.]|nr:Peptide transporter ATP-binding protein [Rhizobacter sp.]